jgi:putative nucleotidyltransferase with HDIG domain
MPATATAPVADLPELKNSPALRQAVASLGASAGGASASRLLGLLYDPEVDIDRILQCLHGEPVLSARVLKVANSPYYGRSGQVGSVERAVQLLGLVAVRGIAAAGALDRITPARAGQPFDPLRFRRHSAAVACAAQALSRKGRCDVDGEAFMAGLLHDIGILLLVKADPLQMASFQPPAGLDVLGARKAEQQHLGLDHETAGVLLVRTWALPPWLTEAVAHHHGPEALEPAAEGPACLPRILALADHLADAAGFGMWARCGGAPDLAWLQGLKLSADDLQAVAETLPQAVEALASGG